MGAPILTLIIEIMLLLWVWDTWREWRPPLQPPELLVDSWKRDSITGIAFSRDGRRLIAGGNYSYLRAWDVATGNMHAQVKLTGFSTGGWASASRASLLALGVGNRIELRQLADLQLVRALEPSADEDKDSAHSHRVVLALSTDGTYLASTAHGGKIYLWDTASGKVLRNWESEASPSPEQLKQSAMISSRIKKYEAYFRDALRDVRGMAFSPDGRRLASAGDTGAVEVWEVPSGGLRHTLRARRMAGERQAPVWMPAFSTDGALVAATGSDGLVRVWQADSGKQLAQLTADRFDLLGRAFAAARHEMHFARGNNKQREWGSLTQRQLRSLAGLGGLQSSSPDGTRVALVSHTGIGDTSASRVQIWDAGTGRLQRTLSGRVIPPRGLAIQDGGRQMVVVTYRQGTMNLDLADGRPAAGIPNNPRSYYARLSQDGRLLARLQPRGKAYELTLIDTTSSRVVRSWPASNGQLGMSNRWIAVADDEQFRLLPVSGREKPVTLVSAAGLDNALVDFAPDGRQLVLADGYGQVETWDLVTGKGGALPSPVPSDPVDRVEALLGRADRGGTDEELPALAVSPDRRRAAVGRQDTLELWDLESRRAVVWIKSPASLHLAAFSPDGQTLATASQDNELRLWEVGTGRGAAAARLLRHATTWDNGVALRHARDIRPGATLAGHTDQVNALVFSPNGRWLFSAADDGTIRVWDAARQVLLMTYILFDRGDWALIAPDGRFDASPGALRQVYWLSGERTHSLAELQTGYRVPGLWARLLAGDTGRPARDIRLELGQRRAMAKE